jgi:hypothetical protein
VQSRWADFDVAIAGASAALTGLLFVAVSLRPREIRHAPVMIGRARAAFYAFSGALFACALALVATSSRLVGVAQLGVAVALLGASAPFTLAATRAGNLNYRRAAVYHAGMLLVAAAGLMRAVQGYRQANAVVLASGVLLLVAIALSNSWQLVISHEADDEGSSSD